MFGVMVLHGEILGSQYFRDAINLCLLLSRARVTVPCKQSLLPKIIVDFNQSAFLFEKLTPNFERTFTPRG